MSAEETQPPSPLHQNPRNAHVPDPRSTSRRRSTLQSGPRQSRALRRASELADHSSRGAGIISPSQRDSALQQIQQDTQARHDRLEEYNSNENSSNEAFEEDSEMPIYDSYYERGGSEAIRTLTNFTGAEFLQLYECVHSQLSTEFRSGRGRRSKYHNADILLMTLSTLKSGTDWDTAARPFNISTSSFMRLVTRCIESISTPLAARFVDGVNEEYDMHSMLSEGRKFESFPCARYATDVVCQQINRPSGNIEEVKIYYSGKHKFYGFKSEVSVLPNGLAIACSPPHKGSTADLRILQGRRTIHRGLLEKLAGSNVHEDNGPLEDKFSEFWAMLCNKGYQGAAEFLRCISPYKRTRNRLLTDNEETFNAQVARDRIIVEHFFGRMQLLWGVIDRKWTWRENLYEDVFKMCVALTNFHIEQRPLRREDVGRFQRARNRSLSMARFRICKRAEAVQAYVNNRRARRGEPSRAVQAENTR